MQINVIYDQSASSLPAGFVAAVNYVVNYFDTTFTNPVTVNIDLGYGEIAGQSLGSGALGESETYFDSFSYAQTVNALKANQPSAAQQAAYSTLPGASPVSGGTLWASTGEEKALGLLSGNNSAIDGYVGVSSTYPFSYSASATPASGQYYFDGVLAHEFSEVLGRSSMLGQGLGGTNSYTVMDLFRYSAPGTRQLGTGGPAYFSINNGSTNIDSWNTNSNGDLGDWAGSAGADAFLAFSSSGQINWITQSDLTLLNVLGWDTTASNRIAVTATSSEALQGGSSVTLLAAVPNITDQASSTLASATIKITNGGGSAVLGDELYVNGQQSGKVAGGAVTVSWNDSTKVLTLTGSASIATYDTLLSQVAYKDTGTDTSSGSHPQRTVTWTVNDGSTNLSTTSLIAVDRAPVANNDIGTDVVGTTLAVSASGGVLANDTDLDADTLAVISVSDTANGMVGQPLAGVYGHLKLNADGSYTYTADISSAINSAPTGSHLHDVFSYTAGDGKGGNSSASTLNITLDRLPVVTVSNLTLGRGQSVISGSSLFTAIDPDGDTITKYAFWDTGAGGGHFLVNGVAQGTNQEIDVTTAQLAQVTYQSGSGADMLWVRAYDGTQWSPWSNSFTATALVDTGPVVTPTSANVSATHTQSFAASSLFTYADPFGDAATQYDVWDTGSGGGRFALNGSALGANQDNFVSAAQLAQLTYQSGSGTDTLWVRASDGTQWSAWSNSFTVTAPVDTGPVETVSNLTASHGQSFAGPSLFTYSDPFGSAATQYDVWDTGSGGGHFVLNGVMLGANQDNIITAAQLAQLSYQSGSGADTLWVRANDGTVLGPWSNSFTVTAPVDSGPVEMVSNLAASHGQSFAGSSLFTYSDPFGSAATQYDVWDTGSGGGHFVLNGVTLGANQDNIITAAQLAQLSYQSGSGADTLWVRANDGTVWGAWSNSFTVTAPIDTGLVETPTNSAIVSVQGQSFAGLSLFTYSDPFGRPATQYDFWDTGGGGGQFLLNGSPLGANQDNIITAAQLSQLTYQVGSGTDTLWVRANDGTVWGAWSPSFTISDPSTIGAGATLELASAYSATLSFAGATGTLKIDHSLSFSGKIGGQLAIGDVVDLADVTAGANATIGYTGNNSPGTLTVSDGTHTASIALLGNYSLANFIASSDGHGGTSVVDPPLPDDSQGGLNQQMALLSQSMATFEPSRWGGSDIPRATLLASEAGQLSNLTQPIANQQHA